MVSPLPFQKATVFFSFLIKIILFTLKIYFYNERRPKFRKNQWFSNMFTFLSVIRQNFKYNLRILANFRVNTQKSTKFAFAFSKNYNFWGDFLIKVIHFTHKIYFFTMKDPQIFAKISFFVTFLHF